jgi:hypothetical protein
MKLTVETMGRLTEESIPENAKQELLAIFHDWKSR